MVGAAVTRLVPDEGSTLNITSLEGLTVDEQRAVVAASVTILMGIFQVMVTTVPVNINIVKLLYSAWRVHKLFKEN